MSQTSNERASTGTNGAAHPKRLIINLFDMFTPGHLTPGLWKHPTDITPQFDTIEYWTRLAKLAEKGKLQGIFIADVLGGYDVYNGNLDAALRDGAQFPVLDPLLIVSAMAAVTKNIYFGITASTSYEHPYALARRFSTLDHLTKGRIAWNIVTSYLRSAAKNFGLDDIKEHGKRYEIAEEYMEVVYKLWESSWSDDAVKKDAKAGVFFEPSLVRQIDHNGEHFPSVPGPHIVHPSIQRTPLLYQAGTSGPGVAFSSRHAEAVFISTPSPEGAIDRVKEVRAKAKELGRAPNSVKLITLITPILGRTQEEAERKHEDFKKFASREGALALFGGWTGQDLSTFGEDEELRFQDTNAAIKSMVSTFARVAPDVPKWTKGVVADWLSIGGFGPIVVGTPQSVADELQRWVDIADVDGFNFSKAHQPQSFEDIVDLLVPELQKRGLHWSDYPQVPKSQGQGQGDGERGLSARESIHGVGQTRLREDHPASQYKWKQ